jgi:hypothetical protein
MLFGLRNTGQSFQQLMDMVTADLPAAYAYLDNIIVTSGPVGYEAVVRHLLECRVDTKFRDTKFREISHQKLISYFAKFLFYFAKFREIS